ncbi:MAG TPA: hypothetical protein VEL74_07170 [Thermoanaerobaculia bacterium]|nr:hypothetical protein [Thermoanaerobaculia bacterium]
MSPEGDWLLLQSVGVRLFRGGEEQAVAPPTGLAASGACLQQGAPVLAGLTLDLIVGKEDHWKNAPWLLRWEGDRWEPLVSSPVGDGKPKSFGRALEERNLQLFCASDGRVWAAYDQQHHFRQYTAGGRLLREVVVSGGGLREAPNAEALRAIYQKEARVLAEATGGKVIAGEITSQRVAKAITEASDGRMYFLIEGGARGEGPEMALERFDPATLELARLPLGVPSPGAVTMAAAQDGIYIAAYKASSGIWLFPWQDLDQAEWIPIDDVAVSVEAADLDGAWREKGGRGLVRFDKDKVITWEDGRLTVRGLVSLEGTGAVLRRAGFGESWKIARKQATLRIERDGTLREYTRLAEIPKAVSLEPAPLAKAKELAPERVAAIRADLDQRVRRAAEARKKTDLNEWRLAVADNLRYLRELTAENGWIDVRRFGVKAASQAATLAQDGSDVLLMLAALPFLEKDLKPVPEGAAVYSGFYDALQVALGGKQRYGTQIVPDGAGEPVVLPIESRAQVDPVRKKIGLEPLAEFLALASRSLFQGKTIRIAEGEVVEAPKAPAQVGAAAISP